MIGKVQYTCIGSEGRTINIPAAGGKEIIAAIVDGYSKKIISIDPESGDDVKIDNTYGDITLVAVPQRGLNILVIYKLIRRETIPITGEPVSEFDLIDFSLDDFA